MTRSVRLLVAACAILLATGCHDSPTTPSGEMASFTAQLSPANEVPPVANTEASGSGNVTVTFAIQRDAAGAIVSTAAAFQVTLLGFPPGTTLTMAHIHRGAVGVVGPVVVDTGLTTGEVVLTTGTGAFNKAGISVAPALAEEILNGSANFYFNVHSALNGLGMARGQLVRQ